MASELRVNTINSRTGFGTITVSATGQDLVGITTIENLTTENTLVGAAASFTGNVSVGGVLTYEDVTNIDSVGLITARQGIEIGARPGVAASISVDGNMVVSGVSTFGGAGQFGGNVEISSGTLHVGDEIAHYGDTDTNIGFPAADTFTVDTAGSERVRITSDGKIGVGVVAPVGTFEIRDSKANLIVAKDGLTAISNTDAHTTYDLIQLGAGGGLASYSTATATADTHLVHNAYRHSGGSWKYKYDDTAMRFRMNSPGGAFIFDNAASGSAGGTISFSERLRIDASGHIGQGVTPSGWATNGDFKAFQLGTGIAVFGRGSGDLDRGGISANYYHTGSAQKYIGDGHAGRIYFEDGSIVFSNAAQNSSGADAALTLTERLKITDGGNVTIGKTSALGNGGTAGIELNGSSHYSMFVRGSNVPMYVGRNSTTGTVVSYLYNGTERGKVETDGSVIAYNTSSDYRLKENEATLTNGIEKLKQLKPYTFNFKDTPNKIDQGFFAHEVQTVVPGAVSGTKDAVATEDDSERGIKKGDIDPQQMDYAKLTPLLTAALQEAIAKIETLESEVAALKSS